MFSESWFADRTRAVEVSGIRKVFDLAKSLKNPINLSIGQPHFDVPEPVRAAAKAAIDAGHNGYTLTQGIPELREKLLADVQARFPGQDRDVVVTSGTSGGLMLALLAVVNPGDEVITPDPYFVAYPNVIGLAGGKMVTVDTYPDFRLDPDRVKAAITPRTKVILLSTPSNPAGAVIDAGAQRAVVDLARAPASWSSATRSTGRSTTTARPSARPRSTRTCSCSKGSARRTGSPGGGSAGPTARAG